MYSPVFAAKDVEVAVTYDPAKRHRRSIRLDGFDYSTSGAYFVTLCAHNHQCLFGRIMEEEMLLTDAGRMLQEVWQGLPERLKFVQLDEYIVMPNHFHAILFISRGEPCVRPYPYAGDARSKRGETCVRPSPYAGDARSKHEVAPPRGTADSSLGQVIQVFKSLCTVAYGEGVNHHGWPRYNETLWQRNYYERVLRDDDELRQKREYIENNVLRWDLDPENLS